MPESLPTFLKKRAETSFHNFVKQIEDLSADQALRYAALNWPGHRWGIGQDGSIAGIVYHVAAWKEMTLPLLSPGEQAISQQAFDRSAAPDPSDWPGLAAWYRRIGAEWNARLSALSDEQLDMPLRWEGMTLTVAKLIAEMVEHDIQHASQIEYLRQRMLAE